VFRCIALLIFFVLSILEGRSQESIRSPFFGKTVSFSTAWCDPPDKNCGGGLAPISFAEDGTLTEVGMGGDPIQRRHPFGKLDVVRLTTKHGTKRVITTMVTGRGNSIEIVTVHKMLFKDGDTSETTDRYKFVAIDGSTCTLTGVRHNVDQPDNIRSKLVLVTKSCTFR
jgi:hypothetical protein